jgi:hypothetical protein
MYNKIRNIGLILTLTICVHAKAQEQSLTTNTATATVVLGVTEVSLVKASSGIINLQLKQRDAGQSIETNASDSTARLLISSVISTSNPRILTAKISSGTVPSGTQLELTAMQPNPNFVGLPGTYTSPIPLDETDKPFVTNIESCYSGTGLSDGYPLRFTYTLNTNPATYSSLRASSGTQIVVMFTLTAVQ